MKQDVKVIHTTLHRFEKAREIDVRLAVGLEFFQYLSDHPLLLELPKFRVAVNRKIAYLRTIMRTECKNAMTVFESHHFQFMTEEERKNDEKAVAILRNVDQLEDAILEVELHMLPYE
jgi:hypothetical protein